MAIFSRRNMDRILAENSQFLTKAQLRRHVNYLNGPDEIRRVTAEWEIAVLNSLSKFGEVVHEPAVPGTSKIDALFRHLAGSALIEITAVSDRGLDDQNPVGALAHELSRRVGEFGLNPNRFSLKVNGNSHELFLGGPRPRLYLPQPDKFEELVSMARSTIFWMAFVIRATPARSNPIWERALASQFRMIRNRGLLPATISITRCHSALKKTPFTTDWKINSSNWRSLDSKERRGLCCATAAAMP